MIVKTQRFHSEYLRRSNDGIRQHSPMREVAEVLLVLGFAQFGKECVLGITSELRSRGRGWRNNVGAKYFGESWAGFLRPVRKMLGVARGETRR